jgi:hypothetical protein
MEVVARGESRGVLPIAPRLRMLILAVLAVMAAGSLFVGVKEALERGIDFQWSGSHLVMQHQDPWKTYLEGDPGRQIIMGQQPNYLPELYLMLGPLGRMPFPEARAWWCGLNLLFLAVSIYLLREMFGLDRDHTVLLTLLVLSSTPFRVTMANGQHGLFVLAMLCVAFRVGAAGALAGSRWLRGLALGLSYGKYSFAPVLVALLLMKRRLGVFLVSLIPPVLGLVVVWRMVGGRFLTVMFEPIATSKVAEGPGSGDLMTLVKAAMRGLGVGGSGFFSGPSLVALLVGVGAAVWIARSRRLTEPMQFALALVVTLACFVHVLYDYVALLPALAAMLTAPRSRARTVGMAAMGVIGYVSSLVNHFVTVMPVAVSIYFVVLVVIAVATARLYAGQKLVGNEAMR